MEIIRPVFSDKNVAVRKCFLKTPLNVLYHDRHFKKVLTADEAVDAYLKGVVIYDKDEDIYYTPIRCRIDEHDVANLLCIKNNNTTQTSADVFEAQSEIAL